MANAPEDEDDVQRIGLLAEPTRRRLYRCVVDAALPLSREQAAERVGVPVHTAKFHLDKLVEVGLLEVEFHNVSGRTGPGSGRPSKHYRPGRREASAALPPRRYDLLSRLLARAVAGSATGHEPAATSARRVAYAEGLQVGRDHPATGDADVDAALGALVSGGYEPSSTEDRILLRNCPFHRAAASEPELVCGINLAYLAGILDGLPCTVLQAQLDPSPGRCCVALAAAPGRS